MPGTDDLIVSHYGTGGLYDRIMGALEENGIAREDVTADHLKYIEEFHIGGAEATRALLDPLEIAQGTTILDVGSGIGGPARQMATSYGAKVTGIDLTPDYVETARRLSDDFGVEAEYVTGSALDLPFDDQSFDLATLIHVGMNLPDKPKLFSEVARVLKPGGRFAVYDVMLFGEHPDFPLPWATSPAESFLDRPEAYIAAAEAAGLTLTHRRERGDMARAFFADMQARMAADGPPVVGPPLLMGPSAPIKVANMIAGVGGGGIAPVELVFTA